jgi:hypothetical protein
MNRPLVRRAGSGKRSARAAQSRYDTDFYTWAMEQAGAYLDVDHFPPQCPYSWDEMMTRDQV